MLTQTQKLPFGLLLLLVSFGSVGAVLFTPGLPEIMSFFQISTGHAQLTISAYLIGYAVGQLPYGPLANRFGRKNALYIGICLAIVGSLLCVVAAPLKSFPLLVIARFLQALGACSGLKMSFTMIADIYDQTNASKMISKIVIAFAIMPAIAVALGGWLTQVFNWQSCFYFLALFGLCMLWLSTKLPETAKSLDLNALNLSSIAHGYGLKFKNKRLMISGLMMGCSSSVVYVFAAKAPFIGINLMGLSPALFGAYNLIPLLGMLAGSFLSAQLAGRLPLLTLLLIGTIGALVATLTMLIPFSMGAFNPLSLFLPMILIYIGQTLVFANVSSFGLTHAKNKSNGSAVLNFTNLSATVVSVFLLEFIYPESALIMPLSFAILFLIMLSLWFCLRKNPT